MIKITHLSHHYLNKIKRAIYISTKGAVKALPPSIISLPIIAQCNHRCKFCEINGVEAKLKQSGKRYQANIMTLSQVKLFTRFIAKAEFIDFGDLTALGEPLLSPHFKKIIKYIRKINKFAAINITTNASFLNPSLAKFLVRQRPLNITFSLHALSEKIYKKLMGKDFEQVIKNIKYFCRTAKKYQKIKTEINFGLGKHNYTDGEKILTFAKKHGINVIHIYPYYKSPNTFIKDVSLYSNPKLANKTLDKFYKKAKRIGQRLYPPKPAYIKKTMRVTSSKKSVYKGGCLAPFKYFILKSDPFNKNKIALSVCNRIVPFHIDLNKKIKKEDLDWAWNHPFFKELRLADKKNVPAICQFCKNPQTPYLRSLDHKVYKQKRDKLVKKTLHKWQFKKFSPNHSIKLLSKNIFSI